MDNKAPRPLAIVTGASSGIGLELARCAARHGYDILAAAVSIWTFPSELRMLVTAGSSGVSAAARMS